MRNADKLFAPVLKTPGCNFNMCPLFSITRMILRSLSIFGGYFVNRATNFGSFLYHTTLRDFMRTRQGSYMINSREFLTVELIVPENIWEKIFGRFFFFFFVFLLSFYLFERSKNRVVDKTRFDSNVETDCSIVARVQL